MYHMGGVGRLSLFNAFRNDESEFIMRHIL
jgi:hypothetical protein